MKLLHSLPSMISVLSPTVLTIGMFDGIHLGHRMLLEAQRQQAEILKVSKTLITFSNHPSTILRPQNIIPLLCTVEHRLRLLEEAGVDTVVLLPFTHEFAAQPAEDFIKSLHEHFLIDALILGSDATLGKNRTGDRETVERVAKGLNFSATYLDDCTIDGVRVSSSRIRDLVRNGDLKEASHLLGRKYSIYAPVIQGEKRGRSIGFPTANLKVNNLCLPPRGVYVATCRYQGQDYRSVANLGIAPTVKQIPDPLLEVHILGHTLDLYDQYIEVFLEEYLRPEQRFDSLDALKAQITRDVAKAKAWV